MKRLLALVIPLVLCGGPALAATPTPPHGHASHPTRASRVRQPATKPPVELTLTSILPRGYLRTNSVLRVHGRLVNQSQTAYQRVSVQLRYSSRAMMSRGEVENYANDKGLDPPQAGLSRVVSTTLPVGGQKDWSLAIPVQQMRLGAFGVYPISVEVVAAGTVLGHQRTFVTYYPTGSPTLKTKVAWVWPVIDQPHRADDSTFVDDHLERQLGSGGRLSNLVAAAARTTTPVTWLIDPSLVDDATHMGDTDGYTIKGSANRPQSVAANDWLRSLHSAVTPGDRLIATPYADPDVMALTQHGMRGDVKLAAQQGVRTLADAHLSGATTVVAMPPDGLADQATLGSLVASGSNTVLLSSTVLPDSRTETFTPDPVVNRTVSGRKVKLVAYDDTLRKILSDTSEPGGTIIAEQRFLAETAMITGEAPQHARTVVITPPRRWNPSLSFARTVLNYTAKTPWLQPVQLSDAENTRPAGRAFQPMKGSSSLGKNYLRQVKELSTQIQRFTSIFTPPASDFTLGVPRVESSAWNGQSRYGKDLRHTLETELNRATGKIKVLNDGITMAGRSGRIPITISNGLDRGTVVVKLHAYSQNDTRLRVNSIDRTLVLEPGHKDQVTLNMRASANGIAYVNLELLTPDGHSFDGPHGGPHVLHVRATGYGRTALLITGISLAVLFVGVAIRIMRRRADRAEESVE